MYHGTDNSVKMRFSEGEPNSMQLPENLANFLVKLWTLVNDPNTEQLIGWSTDGRSFIIKEPSLFARDLLPLYYKHNHMASFVRQLNMYGFHKKISPDVGGLRCDKDDMEFAHPYFCRGHPSLTSQIKRKTSSTKNQNQDSVSSPFKPELMTKVLTEVKGLQGRQEQFDSVLGTMKHENEILWRELMVLRQKHLQQQKIVNKLIHFLITLVQSRRGGLTVKRRLYPLMIDNSSRPRKKSKLAEPEASPTGPVIHELDTSEPGLDSEYIVNDMMENEDPAVQSPESTNGYVGIEMPEEDGNNDNIRLITDSGYLEEDEIEIPEAINLPNPNVTEKPSSEERRKTKVPVKILIPPLEFGDKPREELHLLEMPVEESTAAARVDSPMNVILLKKQSIDSKPVPAATVRSSKLAAMAANMKKSQQDSDEELDTETSADVDDDASSGNDTSSLVKLGNILTVPNISNSNNNIRSNNEDIMNVSSKSGKATKGFNNHIHGGKSVLKTNSNRKRHKKDITAVKPTIASMQEEKDSSNVASTSSSKDLSLSCVNSSSASEANYREELGSHLESMQAELDNIRDILTNEGYSIDANTLIELFGNVDEPMPFGIHDLPLAEMDTEVNDDNKEGVHSQISESLSGLNRGELMAYNNSSNFFDFEDMFTPIVGPNNLDPTSPLSIPETTDVNSTFDPAALDLEDTKTCFLDNIPRKDMNSRS